VAKKNKKVARKKVRKNSAHVHSIFRTFSLVFAGENAAKHALSLDLTFQSLPNYSAQITLRILAFFCWPKHSASPSNDLCIRLHSKGSDTAANLTFVIL